MCGSCSNRAIFSQILSRPTARSLISVCDIHHKFGFIVYKFVTKNKKVTYTLVLTPHSNKGFRSSCRRYSGSTLKVKTLIIDVSKIRKLRRLRYWLEFDASTWHLNIPLFNLATFLQRFWQHWNAADLTLFLATLECSGSYSVSGNTAWAGLTLSAFSSFSLAGKNFGDGVNFLPGQVRSLDSFNIKENIFVLENTTS